MKKFVVIFLFFFIPVLLKADVLQPGPLVRIYDHEYNFVREYYAYDQNLNIGVNAVMDDFNNDKTTEIITAPQAGGGPQIRIFNLEGKVINNGWFAFSESFRGGVNLAKGDINGDGAMDLIAAQASQGQAWVKVYDLTKKDPRIISEFLAYPEFFEGGAFVAAGDIDKNGKDEIITGAGFGGGPQVRAFNKKGECVGVSFFPFPNDYSGGVTVASGDVDGDGTDEIIMGQAYAAQAWVKVYESDAKSIISEFNAFSSDRQYGATVSVADINKDNKEEIIIGPGSGGGPQARIFNAEGKNLSNFFAYDESFRGKTAINYYDNNFIATVAPLAIKRIIKGPKVALTFDDGYGSPAGSFNKILDTLKAHNLQVTFFLLGNWMVSHPAEVKRIAADGHEIGNHSFHHPLFTRLSEAQIRNEVLSTENLIKQITGIDPKPNFRYPYGGHNAYTDAVIAQLGYKYYQWTASTGDTGANKSVQSSVNGALWNLHDGGIILAHCQSDATAAGLDTIIHAIENSGYSIVKISELDG